MICIHISDLNLHLHLVSAGRGFRRPAAGQPIRGRGKEAAAGDLRGSCRGPVRRVDERRAADRRADVDDGAALSATAARDAWDATVVSSAVSGQSFRRRVLCYAPGQPLPWPWEQQLDLSLFHDRSSVW